MGRWWNEQYMFGVWQSGIMTPTCHVKGWFWWSTRGTLFSDPWKRYWRKRIEKCWKYHPQCSKSWKINHVLSRLFGRIQCLLVKAPRCMLAFPLWLVKLFDVQIPFLHDYTPKFWWLNPTVRQMNSRLVAKLSFEMARPLDFVCSVCSYVLTIHIHHPPTLTSPEARRLRLDRRPPHVLGSAQVRPTKTGKLEVLKNDLVNRLTF